MICCNHSLQRTVVWIKLNSVSCCILASREGTCHTSSVNDSSVVEKVKMTCFHWLTSLHFSAPTPHSKAKIYSLVTGREDLYVCFCLADGTLKEKWSRLQAQLCTRETLSAFHLTVCTLWEGRLMSESSIVRCWKSIRDANGKVHCSRANRREAHGPDWWLIFQG